MNLFLKKMGSSHYEYFVSEVDFNFYFIFKFYVSNFNAQTFSMKFFKKYKTKTKYFLNLVKIV